MEQATTRFSTRINIRVYNAILEHSNATGPGLALLLVLAKWANDDGMCYPGIQLIAAAMHVSERWVKTVKKKLIQSGELKLEGKHARYDTDICRIVCVPISSPGGVNKTASRGEQPNTCPAPVCSPKEQTFLSSKQDPIPHQEEPRKELFTDRVRPEQDSHETTPQKNSGGRYGNREPRQWETWGEKRERRRREAQAETYRRLGLPLGTDV